MYKGPLNPKKMGELEKRAYWIWSNQKGRCGVKYTSREFIAWYCKEYRKKNWKRAHVARFDHNKPYSFENIEMQEQLENIRERNQRRGNPCKTHRKVCSYTHGGKKLKEFKSKREAAKHYGINEKTIYNHCMKKSKEFNIGPRSKTREVTFRWADV